MASEGAVGQTPQGELPWSLADGLGSPQDWGLLR